MLRKYLTFLLILISGSLLAQSDTSNADGSEKNADAIAKELSNPVGSLSSLTFQGTYAQWGGSAPDISSQNTSSLIFMPTLPFKIGKGNLSVRPSFPVSAAPVPEINSSDEIDWKKERGFGDIGIMALYGMKHENGLIWGVGPTMFFPTASNEFVGTDQFQLGPAVLGGVIKKWGVLGVLWQHWWGMSDVDPGESKVNLGTGQLFYWFGMGNGWQLGGSPVPSANYTSATDVDFSVPVNLGVAKTVILGKMPLKFTVQGQYFVTRPDVAGPDWGVFFQIVPVIKVPW
jgi:hypothetical protein